MVDILAQIINVVILKKRIREENVTSWNVFNYLKSHNIAPYVSELMGKLLESNEFQYINAFCNTIKHRRLINTRFRAEYGENYRNESGIKFVEFNYKGVTYPETWGSDFLGNKTVRIRDLVTDVRIAINKYVQQM
jgi:hypothetical protein